MEKIVQSSEENMRIRRLWINADCVCFDVDSTVCIEEAIDELAKFQQVGHLVEAITRNAMAGNMSFRTALQARLNLIKPTKSRLQEFLLKHPPQLTDGISDLVKLLHQRKTSVYLVTGGFHSVVDSVAEKLGIPLTNVFANRLLFNDDGSYAGFDENEMTSDSGGKRSVVEHLKSRFHFQNLIMIGDGATDMEANADGFIGFGGNVVRESVRNGSSWFVHSFRELIDEFQTEGKDPISSNDQTVETINTRTTYSTEIKAK